MGPREFFRPSTHLAQFARGGMPSRIITGGKGVYISMQEALADHPNVGEVRGEGLLLAVELAQDRETRTLFDPGLTMGAKAAAALLKRGVITRAMPQGDILGYAPPLCLSSEEADTIVSATKMDFRKEVLDMLTHCIYITSIYTVDTISLGDEA